MLKVKKKRKNKIIFTVVILVLLITVWRVERKLSDFVDFYAVAVIRQQVNTEITQIMQTYISNNELLILTRDSLGNIVNAQLDAAKMANTKALISNEIDLYFADNSICYADIHLGNLFGSVFLQNIGPKIKLKFYPTSSVVLKESSEFLSAGVNQSLQRIVLSAEIEINCVAAGRKVKTNLTNSFVIAENVIVGQVPSGMLMD